jgi:hypothetical protein
MGETFIFETLVCEIFAVAALAGVTLAGDFFAVESLINETLAGARFIGDLWPGETFAPVSFAGEFPPVPDVIFLLFVDCWGVVHREDLCVVKTSYEMMSV